MAYNNISKPVQKSFTGSNGNMEMGKIALTNNLFGPKKNVSISGYAGTSEFEGFPLRQLFLSTHGSFPSEWDTGWLTKETVNVFLSKKYEKNLIAVHYMKNGIDVSKCVLYLGGREHLYVYFYIKEHFYNKDHDNNPTYGVCLLFTKKTKTVSSLIDRLKNHIIEEEKVDSSGMLNILVNSNFGLTLEQRRIEQPDINFDMNYNEDFKLIHELILDKLSIDNSKGLVLLHGIPGTGKTTYIRYLIHLLKKRIIYIPPNMTHVIAEPTMVKFLMDYSNSILVIEDAENILLKRGLHSTQAIANILNLSDGLLSDCANIQILATFNTSIINIDNALLRKGRLIAKYEFKQLSEDRVVKLSEKLGVRLDESRTLADIYNSEGMVFINDRMPIGFKSKQIDHERIENKN